jgi:hypothetical protein
MKAILIDPQKKSISEIESDFSLTELKKIIEAKDISEISDLSAQNIIYITGESDKISMAKYAFKFPPTIIFGKAVIGGISEKGERRDYSISIDEIKNTIAFLSLKESEFYRKIFNPTNVADSIKLPKSLDLIKFTPKHKR